MLTYDSKAGKLFRPDEDNVNPPVVPSCLDSFDEPKLKGATVLMFDISIPDLDPSKLATTGKSLTELMSQDIRDDDGAPISIPIPPTVILMNEQYIATLRPLSDVRPSNHFKKGICHLVNPRDLKFSAPTHTVTAPIKSDPIKPSAGLISPVTPLANTFGSAKLVGSSVFGLTPKPAESGLGLQKKPSGAALPSLLPSTQSKDPSPEKPPAGPLAFQSMTDSAPTKPAAQPPTKPTIGDSPKPQDAGKGKEATPKPEPQPEQKPTITQIVEGLKNEVKDDKLKDLFAKFERVLIGCQKTFCPEALASAAARPSAAAVVTGAIGLGGTATTRGVLATSAGSHALPADVPSAKVPKLQKLTIPTNDTVEALLQGVREALDQTKIPFQKHRTLKRIFSLLEEKDKRLQAIKSPACLAQLQEENDLIFARLEATELGVQEAQRRLRAFLTVFKDDVAKVSVQKPAKPSNHSLPQLPNFGTTKVYNSFFGSRPDTPSYMQAPVQQVTFSSPPAASAPQKPVQHLPPPPVSKTPTQRTLPTFSNPRNLLPIHLRPSSSTQALSALQAFLQQTIQDKSEHYDLLLRELHNLQRVEQKRLQARGAMQRLSQFRNTVRPHSAAVLGGDSALAKSRGTVFDLRNLGQDDSDDESVEEVLNQNGYTAHVTPRIPGWLVPSSIKGVPEGQRRSKRANSSSQKRLNLKESLQFLEALKTAQICLEYCLNLSLRKELETRAASARAAQVVNAMTVPSNPPAPAPVNTTVPAGEVGPAKGPTSSLFGAVGSKPAEAQPATKPEGMFASMTVPKAPEDQSGKQPAPVVAPKKDAVASNLGGIFTDKPNPAPSLAGSNSGTAKPANSASGIAESTVINTVPGKTIAADPLALFQSSKPAETPSGAAKPADKPAVLGGIFGTTSTQPAGVATANPKPLLPTAAISTGPSGPTSMGISAGTGVAIGGSGSLFGTSGLGQPTKPAEPAQPTPQASAPGKSTPKQGMGIFSQSIPEVVGALADNLASPPRKGAGDAFLGSLDIGADATAKRKQSTINMADPRMANKSKPTQMNEVPEEEEEEGPLSLKKSVSVIGSTDTAGNPTKKVYGISTTSQPSGNQPPNTPAASIFGTSSGPLAAGVSKSLFDSSVNPNDKPAGPVTSTGFAPANSGSLFASMGVAPINPPKPAETQPGTAPPTTTAGGIFGTKPATTTPSTNGLFNSFGTATGAVGGLFQTNTPAPAATGLSFTAGGTQNIFASDSSKAAAAPTAFGQTASFSALGKPSGGMGSSGFGMGSSGFGTTAAVTGFQVPATLANSSTGGGIFGGTSTGPSWLAAGQTGASQQTTQNSQTGSMQFGGALGNIRG